MPRESGEAGLRCSKSWARICARRKPFASAKPEGKKLLRNHQRPAEPFGWRTFDQSALEAFESNTISEETALLYCTKRGPVTRGIDNVKKSRGETTTDISTLRMKEKEKEAAAKAPNCW